MNQKHMKNIYRCQPKANLNVVEQLSKSINDELSNGEFAWHRNLDRKIWSLGISNESNGIFMPMYPDLIIARTY